MPAKSLHTAKSASRPLKSSIIRMAETEGDVEAVEDENQVESEKRKGEVQRRLTAVGGHLVQKKS